MSPIIHRLRKRKRTATINWPSRYTFVPLKKFCSVGEKIFMTHTHFTSALRRIIGPYFFQFARFDSLFKMVGTIGRKRSSICRVGIPPPARDADPSDPRRTAPYSPTPPVFAPTTYGRTKNGLGDPTPTTSN